jgi:hypothetical protein
MKISELVSSIAQFEGKKVEVSVGNIREIISILSDLVYFESLIYKEGDDITKSIPFTLLFNGRVRAKARARTKNKKARKKTKLINKRSQQ